MNERSLTGGVIGFGRMGMTHFSILNAHPDVELVAVCDPSGFIRKNVANYIGARTFEDPDDMFRGVQLDFVVVATPTATHAETVKMAVAQGLHVFVEKPFALNTEQGEDVVRSVEKQPIVNQVGYVLRFSDVFMQVKRLLEAGILGELLSFKMEMYGPTVLYGAKSSWRSKKSQGGGCLYDFASHSIDMINNLIGVPDEIRGTVLKSIYSDGVEDAISSTFLYKSGLYGNLLVSWSDPSYRKPTYGFEISGRNGKISADLHSYRVFLRSKVSYDGFVEGWNQRYVTDFFEPVGFYLRGYEFTRQLDHFVNCLKQGQGSDACSFAQALQADIVIDRIRQDAERG